MSIPPGPPLGHSGGQYGSPAPRPPVKKRRWLQRHPVWSALIAVAAFLVVVIGVASANNKPASISNTAAAAAAHSTASPAASSPPLKCRAQTSSKRPRDHTTVTIKVHTVAHAKVIATGRRAPLISKKLTGSANAYGNWTVRVRVGNAKSGSRVVVTVRVSRHGATGSCQTSFRPRAAAAHAATPATPATSAVPATQPAQAPSPAPVTTQPAASPSCYPISDEGTCYEPGEYCRDDDHGMTGVAGDGESIVCEDDDGWRWEPV